MSRTRGPNSPGRTPLDFYETPAEAIDALLDHVPLVGPFLDVGCGTGAIMVAVAKRGLDCIGIEIDEGLAAVAMGCNAGLVIVDDFLAADFQILGPTQRVNSAGGNPPFRHATAMIEAAVRQVPRGGLVPMLLRQGFSGSCKSRRHLFDLDAVNEGGHKLGAGLWMDITLPTRPSFCTAIHCTLCGGGWQYPAKTPTKDAPHPKTDCQRSGSAAGGAGNPVKIARSDSADYSWLVWMKGYNGPCIRRWAW